MHFGRYASRKSEAKYPFLWDGLVGAWCPSVQNPSGTRIYDLSGRNNHGTLTNMDPTTDWVRGNGRGALDLDGSNDNIVVGTNIASSINGKTQMSFSGWCFLRTTGAGSAGRCFEFGNSNFTLLPRQFQGNTTGTAVSFIAADPSLNTWVHVCLVSIVGVFVSLYINGSAVSPISSNVGSGSFSCSGLNMVLANRENLQRGFDGMIDDFIFYDRALRPSEIRLLASQRGIAFTPRRRSIFRQLTNRLRSSRFAAFPA